MTDSMDEHRLDEALEALRRSLTQPPEEHIAQRHLAAMRHAAREQSPVAGWAWRRERRNAMPGFKPRWIATGVAALLGLAGGLAAADLLPDPAQHLVSQLIAHTGVDVPDPHDNNGKAGEQGHNDDGDVGTQSNEHGKTVSSAAQSDEFEGCEHGQAVRDVALGDTNPGDPDPQGPPDGHDPCDQGGGVTDDSGPGTTDGQGNGDVHGQSGDDHGNAPDNPGDGLPANAADQANENAGVGDND